MTLILESIMVETGGPDEIGNLAFVDGRLAAVLVQLSEQHGDRAGHWFFEAGFGPFDGPNHPIFADIDAARAWILGHAGRPTSRSGRLAPPAKPAA